jgi:hypothetical protein
MPVGAANVDYCTRQNRGGPRPGRWDWVIEVRSSDWNHANCDRNRCAEIQFRV